MTRKGVRVPLCGPGLGGQGALARCNPAFPFSVTSPWTPGPDTAKATAAPGSPSRTPEEDRPHQPAPPPREWADSPLVQEPEEFREAGSPRRNSLVIVESADEQPPAFESLDADSAFQKVRALCPSRHVDSPSRLFLRPLCSPHSHQVREPGPCTAILFKLGLQ